MDYHWVRANAFRNAYAASVHQFLTTYRPGRPTVVLLPGGMGSQLDRSPDAFDKLTSGFERYDPVWIDAGVLFEKDALKLEIDTEDRDRDRHIIVPNGPLRFLVKAYDGTEAWARDSKFNYIVFGYDWRRPLEEAAGYLEYFLNYLREAVFRRHKENPLPRTTLFAHSQGGLVAKIFLHRIVDVAAWLERLITVATPFYGTATHMDRYFVGQQPLNALHGTRETARIIATLPGPYALMFIDRATFARDFARLGFASAADYPMIDPAGQHVDPYDRGNAARYPAWINLDHLDRARRIRATIALDLPKAVIDRVVNIRAGGDRTTPVKQRWRPVPGNFDPDAGGASPLETVKSGDGDGTVPAWSACLAQASNRHDLQQAKAHMDLMEHVEVLNLVGPMLDPQYTPVATTSPKGLYGRSEARASKAEIQDLFRDVAESKTGRDDPRLGDERIWRGLIEEMKR